MDSTNKHRHLKCNSCGKLFISSDPLNTSCTHCGAKQHDTSKDNHVIFSKIAKDTQPSKEQDTKLDAKIQKAEAVVNAKLDVVGRKRARRRIFALIICCIWAVIVAGVIYKVVNRDKNKTITDSTSQDGSITKLEQTNRIENGKKCKKVLASFLNQQDIQNRIQHLYNPDIEVITSLIDSNTFKLPEDLGDGTFIVHMPTENILVLHTSTLDNRPIEAVFFKNNDQWLLDWRHFLNYSPVSFVEFLSSQPVGVHKFRIYFSFNPSGSDLVLSFYEAEPNNLLYNIGSAAKESLLLKSNVLLNSDFEKIAEKAKIYRELNKSLEDLNEGLLGTREKPSVYQATVTLNYTLKNGSKSLQLISIDKLHWLDSYYTEPLTPAQKLTYQKR